MLMLSLSYTEKELDLNFYYTVKTEIENLKGYFYKFAGIKAEETMHATIWHTVNNFDRSRELRPYLKKLARTIHKKVAKKDYDLSIDIHDNNFFSDELISNIDRGIDKLNDIEKLVLDYPDEFMTLSSSLINMDTTATYSNNFITECIRVSNRCKNFNTICKTLYEENRLNIIDFLEEHYGWCEADYTLIKNRQSKRILLLDKNNQEIENADIDEYEPIKNISDNRLIKVEYYELWNYYCDLIDSPTSNKLKLVLGNNYRCRTEGGSFVLKNSPLYNMYDLIRDEILTNILKDTGGRIVNIGSECFYLIVKSDFNKSCLFYDNFILKYITIQQPSI